MVDQNLMAQVKRKLNVTWDDAETNARIEEIIETAIPDLTHKLGITDSEFDFSEAGPENKLFKNYCLYEWNHCIYEFDDNYANDIAQVREKWLVKDYIAESENVEDEENTV